MLASPTTASPAADAALWAALDCNDVAAARTAMGRGASPAQRKTYAGLVGESLTMRAVRRGQPQVLNLLLEGGAPCEGVLAVAAAMLVERASQSASPHDLAAARAVVDVLEQHGVNWGATDRLVGAGARALDLLATAQPAWAHEPARRLGLTPASSNAIVVTPRDAPARTRRAPR